MFMYNGSAWSQVTKLVGSNAIGTSVKQGSSVSVSSDGHIVAVGGWGDSNNIGATWIFTYNNMTSNWTQLGSKLVGNGYTGSDIQQGYSVSVSSDGNLLAIGGWLDSSVSGAVWLFGTGVGPTNPPTTPTPTPTHSGAAFSKPLWLPCFCLIMIVKLIT